MTNNVILEVKNINKHFPGVQALKDFSLSINEGDVHALVGENGAGKSTLIKIISGAYQKEDGEIYFNGEQLGEVDPIDCISLGISTVHQELRLVEELAVFENILLGAPVENKSPIGKVVDWKESKAKAQALIDSMDIDIDVNETVANLSIAKKQIVEICKALSRKARLVIMDEPSATLTEKELQILFRIIRHLKEQGITIIYISHRLEEIFEIADKVTVMRDGEHIITDDVSNMNRRKLIAFMVGREIDNIYPDRQPRNDKVLLTVENLNVEGLLHDVSFQVHEGEILGIAGLVGSGRTDLARAIFGVDKITSGRVSLRDEPGSIGRIKNAIKKKLALVPEDRTHQGIIPDLSVGMNISLVGIDHVIEHSFINSRIETLKTNRFIDQLRIQTPSNEQKIKFLSGGNQQKCVLAKWLFVESDLLIFDEPTRGIDVGAKQEIYRLLVELASQGKGIIMISSELPEILGISHRILVMHDGHITGEVYPESTNQEEIIHLATI